MTDEKTTDQPEKNVEQQPTGLALLMVPFSPEEIGKLPKPTKAQTEEVKANFKAGIRCDICGGWHHPKVVHLDYVGHAALTKRLLQADPQWSWEPMALTQHGTPLIDQNNGMWIRLTVCGVTRLGYGFAEGKGDGNAIKEIIGDALRNAAMRFGAALDLWHKGDLHHEDELKDDGRTPAKTPPPPAPPPKPPASGITAETYAETVKNTIAGVKTVQHLDEYLAKQKAGLDRLANVNMTLRDEIEQASLYRRMELNPFE